MMKTRKENDVIDHIGAFYAKKVLNFRDRLDRVQSMMKTR